METVPLDIHRFKSKKGASVSEEFALFNWSSVGSDKKDTDEPEFNNNNNNNNNNKFLLVNIHS